MLGVHRTSNSGVTRGDRPGDTLQGERKGKKFFCGQIYKE